MNTFAGVSKNPPRQKELFGELPIAEESVRQYGGGRGLI
jgi:hypothetical protein